MTNQSLPDHATAVAASPATIRPARWADARVLAGMIADMARHHGDRSDIDHLSLSRMIEDTRSGLRVLVAEKDGQIVGYAALYAIAQLQFARRGIEVHHLFVAPSQRRQGIGRALMQAARDLAREDGCSYVGLSALAENIDAHSAYLAMGFEQKSIDTIRFNAAVA